jgi:preprotein translocase subunit YajC
VEVLIGTVPIFFIKKGSDFMFLFITKLHALGVQPPASGGEAAPGGALSFLFPLAIVFGIFYLLVFRPQKKQQKELKNMVESLKKNDKVITSAGIYGQVHSIDDIYVSLKIDDKVKMKVLKSSIARILTDDKKE